MRLHSILKLFSKRNSLNDEYDSGMGTTPLEWELLSELLEGEKLPDSLNKALYALRDRRAKVVLK